ncbi:MAG: hypothetical protein ACI90V_011593 [Bacillariaceae sp.]|jgi:hypothetical protein
MTQTLFFFSILSTSISKQNSSAMVMKEKEMSRRRCYVKPRRVARRRITKIK